MSTRGVFITSLTALPPRRVTREPTSTSFTSEGVEASMRRFRLAGSRTMRARAASASR